MRLRNKIASLTAGLLVASAAALTSGQTASAVPAPAHKIKAIGAKISVANCYMARYSKLDKDSGRKVTMRVEQRTRWTLGVDTVNGVGYKRREWTQVNAFEQDHRVHTIRGVVWTLWRNQRIAGAHYPEFLNPNTLEFSGLSFQTLTEYKASPWYPTYVDLKNVAKTNVASGYHFTYPINKKFPQHDQCSTTTYNKGFRYVPA